MRLYEAKEILNSHGYLLEDVKEVIDIPAIKEMIEDKFPSNFEIVWLDDDTFEANVKLEDYEEFITFECDFDEITAINEDGEKESIEDLIERFFVKATEPEEIEDLEDPSFKRSIEL